MFIKHLTSDIANSSQTGITKYQKLIKNFHHKVLMERIRDIHRQISYCEKEISRQITSCQDRNMNQHTISYYLEKYKHQLINYYDYIKLPKLTRKLEVLKAQQPKAVPEQHNLRTARVTTLNCELTSDQYELLSKGPNFAVRNTNCRDKILNDVEVGVERFGYGYRYHRNPNYLNTEESGDCLLSFPPTNHEYKPPAPRLHPTDENVLRDTKNSILSIYKNNLSKKQPTNISKKQRTALKELRETSDIIIKQSDKDKQLVAINKSDYIDMCSDHLADSTTYEEVTKNPLPKMEKEVTKTVETICHDSSYLEGKLQPHCPRIPEFYGTFKTHKKVSPPPLRPVVSGCDGPIDKLATLCNAILQQAIDRIPTNISSTTQFKKRLEEKYVGTMGEEHTMFTADIKALYTNIPLDHCLRVTMEFLERNCHTINMMGLSLEEFRAALSTILNEGYFRFDDKYYRQNKGLAMGVRPAPPLAILYVYLTVELPLLENDFSYALSYILRPLDLPTIEYWDRYVDDVFSVVKGDASCLEKVIIFINKLNPDIQFTYETGVEVSYLDVTVSINHRTKCPDFQLFIKPSNLGVFLNYNSHHPKSILINTAMNEFRRAYNNCSTDEFRKSGYNKISKILLSNEYPQHVINQILQKFDRQIIKGTKQRVKKELYLVLPYIDEQCSRKVKAQLRKSGLLEKTRVVFKSGNTLKQTLVSTKLRPTKCNKQNINTCTTCDLDKSKICMNKNLVYELKCNICQETYVGETCRHLRTRVREHYLDSQHGRGPMGGHFKNNHPSVDVQGRTFDANIIKSNCRDWVDRKLWEAVIIKNTIPAINVQHNVSNNSKKEYNVDSWALIQ